MTAVDLTKPLEGIIYEQRDHVAFITINRPDRGNSLTPAMQPIIRAIWSRVRGSSTSVAGAA